MEKNYSKASELFILFGVCILIISLWTWPLWMNLVDESYSLLVFAVGVIYIFISNVLFMTATLHGIGDRFSDDPVKEFKWELAIAIFWFSPWIMVSDNPLFVIIGMIIVSMIKGYHIHHAKKVLKKEQIFFTQKFE